jgi:ATP-binding cassette subfamily B protein
VQSALSALIRGRTVIVIAHRLSTITGADQILVMDHGRIAERGTHQQLLDAGGRYARMWAAQSLPEGTRR